MPVVFDEVIASVEAPPAAESSDALEGQAPKRDDSAQKAISAIETHARRAQRLEAN
jgi:hypothetical protein